MPALRCLASLLPLAALVAAARPRHESALVANFWKDPCAELGAKRKGRLSRIFKKGTLCQCQEDFFTNVWCDRPSAKDFILRETPSKCRCEDQCARFYDRLWGRAEGHGIDPATGEVLCRCQDSLRVANSRCSRPGQRVFSAVGSAPGCHCESNTVWARSVQSPVETAALRFCEVAVQDSSSYYPKVPSVFACQAKLNGTATVGHGRLDAFLQDLPKTAAWHLTRVCNDECKELVDKTKEEMDSMDKDMYDAVPRGETCAARVVKKVEAEILGCCGRSCGWNGHSCISWPFFEEQQKADWLAECCTEYNARSSVLKNSSREEMCNSVLNQHDADLVSKNDMSQEGRDVAAAYLGQDLQLLWTKEGVDSELGRNYSWLEPKPKAGEEVTERLLQLQPNIRKKALKKRWFEEKKLERASFIQMQDTVRSCDPEEMKRCTDDMKQWRTSVCAKQEGWLFSDVPSKMKCKDMIETMKPATSPHECFDKAKYDKVGADEIKNYAFQYNTKDKENPVKCYAESGEPSCTVPKKSLAEAEATKAVAFDRIWFWINASSAKSVKSAQAEPKG